MLGMEIVRILLSAVLNGAGGIYIFLNYRYINSFTVVILNRYFKFFSQTYSNFIPKDCGFGCSGGYLKIPSF
jgi:hypothetical protein